MARECLKELENIFKDVNKYLGLRLIDRHESKGFGDGYILYEHRGVYVRLISDRGQPFIAIGVSTEPSEAFDLSLITNYVNKSDIMQTITIEEQLEFLCHKYDALIEMLIENGDKNIDILRKIEKERAVRSQDELRTGKVNQYWRTGKI